MDMSVFDDRACFLGEGPMWHPLRQQFFWFDVINRKLLSRGPAGGAGTGLPLEWQFAEHVSAAGWLDREHLLVASETSLSRFNIATGARERVAALDAGNPATRSNDGRADPHGGFWIGTMGKSAEHAAGAIYRYFRGEMRCIHERISIPNSICFSPDGGLMYFADTPKQMVFRQRLGSMGWPTGEPEVFLDLRADGLWPDGSVVDREGAVWNAQWGVGRVARYLADGSLDLVLPVPGIHSSCPAFGGEDLKTLLVTSAQEHLQTPSPCDGLTYFAAQTRFQGNAEPPVLL
jgi:sugar lactone lactonase YvrE